MKSTRWSLVLLGLFAAGCSLLNGGPASPGPGATLPEPGVTTMPAPDADQTAIDFLEAWKRGDYSAMYALLSPLTQDSITEEAFSERYQQVKRGAAVTSVDYQIVSSLIRNPREAEVHYRVSLESAVVGEITRETSMDLVREGADWRVAWTEAAILPELAGGMGLRLASQTPTRAIIYDRNGLPLAAQSSVASLWIVPNLVGDEDAESSMLSILRRLFDLPTTDPILARYDAVRGTNFYTPLGTVPLDDYQRVSGGLESAGGVQARIYDTRYYYGDGLTPFDGGLAPHAVGYVSSIRAEQLEAYLDRGYMGDEHIGQMGLEQAFETELRGTPGGTLYLTDPNGIDVEVLASRELEPPYALYTTLDRDLQRVAKQAIEGFTGAVVVMERDTGAILAMASSPGFDPNLFDPQNPYSGQGLTDLNGSSDLPFLNRATLGLYAPGSVFKLITMAAALESGYYQPDTVYDCGLEFTELPGITLYDWRYEKELPASGELTLQGGLERSCNPWFYHIGLDLYNKGLTTAIPDMAKAFGLGQETGIEIAEDAGLVPDPETKRELYDEDWLPKDPVQLAIGQSFLQVTPLQVARYVAAVGNGGKLLRPHLVQRLENPDGDVIEEPGVEVQGQLPVTAEHLQAIQQAMVNVVRDPKATAYRRFLGLNLNIAGKTGTASTSDFTEPHAWFVGYSFEEREDKPDIAIAVVLEFQGEGSDWAAPVFRRIMEAYFLGRPRQLYPWEAKLRVEKTATPTPGPQDSEATPTP